MLILLFCGILATGAVFGEDEKIDFSMIDSRVILKPRGNILPNFQEASPEIDSREHGVTPGKRSTSCNCGRANRVQGRILGGREYRQFEYPFLAALSYSTSPLRPHCGSVIITTKHILTAAHCTVKAVNGITLFVTIAEHDRGRTPGAYTIPVERLIQHENYNPKTLFNDISLLFLKNPLLLSGAVVPVCMPQPGLNVAGQYVRAVGWGATRFQGPMTARPRKVDLRVIDTLLCHKYWPDNISTKPFTQICSLSRNKTTCQGDSGGPVVWLDPETNRYTLVGLVSAGPPCGYPKPTVYSSVVAFLPWIKKGIQETAPGQNVCTKV
uniref:Venom S1 protease 5 n=1 Tax=Oncocephalus sp. TaxID=2944721 RepID=A0AB38ZEF7_9HEMI